MSDQLCGQEPSSRKQSARGMDVAATVHPLATKAALDIYRAGGNAIDAAVAAAFALGVVDSHNSGIGGGSLILLRLADGTLHAIDGRETASQNAFSKMFYRDGVPQPEMSQTGALAVAVPGQVDSLFDIHRRFGKLKWAQTLENAVAYASDGFAVDSSLAARLADEAKVLAKFPGSAHQLLRENGQPYQLGERLQQPDLAKTLEGIAKDGPDWFYRGPFARAVAAWMKENGGMLTEDDFAKYQCKEREVLRSEYRGNTIIGFPPPSSGGIHVAQMLYMLERFPMRDLFKEQPSKAYHLMLEAMKRAFADRAYWLGDSDFAKVPKNLIAADYCRKLGESIELDRATDVASHGSPPQWDTLHFGDKKHTTHLATTDRAGNWVAITSTVNTSFGSKVIVPGTGVVLNNEMDDFSIAPGTPNAFGLIGAEANSIAPGKRPLSSMSPTLVLDATGHPLLSCGAAGGPKIITAVLRTILGVVDQNLTPAEAISASRVHHQWRPNDSVVESSLDARVVAELEGLGHPIKKIRSSAVAQAIGVLEGGVLESASDPRVPSEAGAIS